MKFIKLDSDHRAVALSTLRSGAVFLYKEKIGMIASRNGRDFPLDLSTGQEFTTYEGREWMPHSSFPFLPPDTLVIPVDATLSYKIKP